MTPRTDYEKFEASSVENRRLLRQEELILEATIALCEAMARDSVTRAELAERLGRTRGYVSQLLSGGRNLTLRTLADVADALDSTVRIKIRQNLQAVREVQRVIAHSEQALANLNFAFKPKEFEIPFSSPPTKIRVAEIEGKELAA